MEKEPGILLKEFDRSQNKRRVRARINVSLPIGLVLNSDLPPSAERIYGALKFLQIGANPVRVSHRQLKELTGLSINTIVKALKRMKTAGWLKVDNHAGDLNVYDFSTPTAE